MRKRVVGYRLVRFILCLAVVAFANIAEAGQGGDTSASIVGHLTDESGAVLPGVTITATSPALQVPELVVFSDARGEYRITPLPIGTYTVVYSLAGFQTFRREALRLTAGFVATVDVALKVGSLEESVTVSGASPVVDIASTGARTAFTRETLELTPTGRNGLISLFAQTPAVRANLDIGGSASSDTLSIRVYGINSESWQTLEGIVTTESRDTQGGNYFDYSTIEEARVQTLSNEADVPARGAYVNLLVKSGGNTFHGSALGAATQRSLQSDNIDDNLRSQGFAFGSALNSRWDGSFDLGGPIRQNKLWFYEGVRFRTQDRAALGVVQPDGSAGNIYQSQGYNTTKLSYQMTPGNRLVGFYFWHHKVEQGSNLTPLIAWETRDQSYVTTPMGKVEWQTVRGNSLVVSLQYSYWGWSALRPIREGVGPSTNDTFTTRSSGLVASAGNPSTAWRGCPPGEFPAIKEPCKFMGGGSMSWYRPNLFMGNHEFKSGFEYIPNSTSRPWEPRAVGDYRLIFNNGAPFQIVTVNAPSYPVTSANSLGIFFKDNWAIHRRVSLNLGVRYAHENGFVPAQCHDAGQFTAAGCIDKIQDTIWNSWVPRLYVAYDVTGNAKTVIKGGWGRFAHNRTTDEVLHLNPFVGTTTTYRWTDPNRNGNYDNGEVNLAINGPDFISSAITDNSAPTRGLVNPDEQQPMEDELSATLERELMTNFGIRASGRYSRRFNNLRRLYPLRPYSAYNIPITNLDPGPDGRLGTADDTGQSFTYYDYPVALRGSDFQQNKLVNDPDANQTFKTIEVAATKRLANRWQLMASYSATKLNIPVPAYSDFNPNTEINTANRSWEKLARFSAAYIFPWAVTGSFNFDHRRGLAAARQVLFTRTGASIPSLVVNVEPLGTRYLPDINNLDLRLDKTFHLGASRSLQGQINVYNLMNINTPTGVTYRSGASFLNPTGIVLPRVMEFSATYKF